jgi:hypothetical protein
MDVILRLIDVGGSKVPAKSGSTNLQPTIAVQLGRKVSMNGSRYRNTGDPMSGSLKLALVIIGAVVAIGLVLQLIAVVWHVIWHVLVPIGILALIGVVVYNLVVGRKALGGNRRYLP